MMSVIDTLITDRTFDDVRFLTDKGLYRASDLNRVEQATEYLAERVTTLYEAVEIEKPAIAHTVPTGEVTTDEYGEIVPVMRTYTDGTWIDEDTPDFEQMKRYLGNISVIRECVPALSTLPRVPDDMDLLTYQEANDIEKILSEIGRVVQNIENSWAYSGEIYCGEV